MGSVKRLMPPLLSRGRPARAAALRRAVPMVALAAALLLAAAPAQGLTLQPPNAVAETSIDHEGKVGEACLGTSPGWKLHADTNGGVVVYVPLGNGESQFVGYAQRCPVWLVVLPLVEKVGGYLPADTAGMLDDEAVPFL